jgi:hypothetical protein
VNPFSKGMVALNLYIHNYIEVLKKNFMLVVMALGLLVVTFFIWTGVPFFLIGSILADFTTNIIIVFVCVSLSGGFLFSLYFVPLNLKVAKEISRIRGIRTTKSFMHVQSVWIIISSLIFAVVLILMKGL